MSSEGEASATGTVVLDASAVLAVLEDESGAEEIEVRLESNLAAIGTVNLTEVVGKLAERGMPEAQIREALSALALEVYPFDESLAFETGMMRPKTKDRGLSLGTGPAWRSAGGSRCPPSLRNGPGMDSAA